MLKEAFRFTKTKLIVLIMGFLIWVFFVFRIALFNVSDGSANLDLSYHLFQFFTSWENYFTLLIWGLGIYLLMSLISLIRRLFK